MCPCGWVHPPGSAAWEQNLSSRFQIETRRRSEIKLRIKSLLFHLLNLQITKRLFFFIVFLLLVARVKVNKHDLFFIFSVSQWHKRGFKRVNFDIIGIIEKNKLWELFNYSDINPNNKLRDSLFNYKLLKHENYGSKILLTVVVEFQFQTTEVNKRFEKTKQTFWWFNEDVLRSLLFLSGDVKQNHLGEKRKVETETSRECLPG